MEIKEEENPWKTLTTTTAFENPWIKITQHNVINPANKPSVYSVVHFKNLAIGIIPLDENYNTWIVGQYRYPLNIYSWEIIEGGGQKNVDPIESAKRELLEETGIKAIDFQKVLEMHLSNSVTDEFGIVYVAKTLSFHEAEPEETEQLQVKKIPFNELYKMVMDGKVTDSLSIAGVLKTKILIDKGLI